MKTLKVLLLVMLFMAITSPAKACGDCEPGTEVSIEADPNTVCPGGTVTLVICEENTGQVNLTNVVVELYGNAILLDLLMAPASWGDDNGNGVLDVNESWCWVVEEVEVVEDTKFEVFGSGISMNDGCLVAWCISPLVLPDFVSEKCIVCDANEYDWVTVETEPCGNTTIDIKANGSDEPITVCEGDQVTLTICEENTGEVDLTGVFVELSENGVPTGKILSAPPDSGDDNGDGVLQPGETWCWDVEVTVTTTTPYDAIGHGFDPAGNDITIPDYPDEYDEVTVETEPCNPDTLVTITGPNEPVCEGEKVTLTICEENTGEVDLTGVFVELFESVDGVTFTLIATLNQATCSGDDNGDGVLQPGETWCWTVDVTVNTNTTYRVIGHGIDPLGRDVTWCGPAGPPVPPGPRQPDVVCDEDERADVTVETKPCDGEAKGCTPGYWKNSPGCWECVAPSDLFSDIFGVVITIGSGKKGATDPTLMQALNGNGGGITALARHAAAAILNACDKDINYPMTVDEIIAAVQDAVAAGEDAINDLKDIFDYFNNAGCGQSSDNAANPCSPSDD